MDIDMEYLQTVIPDTFIRYRQKCSIVCFKKSEFMSIPYLSYYHPDFYTVGLEGKLLIWTVI